MTVLLVVSLFLSVFPMGCARHAYLVSAHVPMGAPEWHSTALKFVDSVKTDARSEGRAPTDLAPIRDWVLNQFSDNAITAADEMRIPGMVREALTHFNRGTLPVPTEAGRIREENYLDPRFVETVEFSVLMAWRAYNRGPEQRISYLVSDRAQDFGWDWTTLASGRLGTSEAGVPIASIETVENSSDRPQMNRIASLRLSADGSKGMVTVLFSVPPVLATKTDGQLTLGLLDSTGQLLAEKVVIIDASTDGAVLENVEFSSVQHDLRTATRIIQRTADAPAVIRELPTSLSTPLRVAMDVPISMRAKLEQSLRFLSDSTNSCTSDDTALRRRSPLWPGTFENPDDGRAVVVSTFAESDVILHVASNRVLLIIPTDTIDPGRLLGNTLPLRGYLSGGPSGNLWTAPPKKTGEVYVLWDLNGSRRVFSANRLGVPDSAAASVVTLPRATTDQIPRDLLFVTAERRSRLGAERLALNAYSSIAGSLERRFEATDFDKPEIVRPVTALAVDLESFGILCGSNITDPDLFFGLWRLIFDRMLDAATPQISVAINPSVQIGAPQIVLNRTDLQSIAIQRVEIPMFVALGVLTLFLLMVALSFLSAARMQRRR